MPFDNVLQVLVQAAGLNRPTGHRDDVRFSALDEFNEWSDVFAVGGVLLGVAQPHVGEFSIFQDAAVFVDVSPANSISSVACTIG